MARRLNDGVEYLFIYLSKYWTRSHVTSRFQIVVWRHTAAYVLTTVEFYGFILVFWWCSILLEPTLLRIDFIFTQQARPSYSPDWPCVRSIYCVSPPLGSWLDTIRTPFTGWQCVPLQHWPAVSFVDSDYPAGRDRVFGQIIMSRMIGIERSGTNTLFAKIKK